MVFEKLDASLTLSYYYALLHYLISNRHIKKKKRFSNPKPFL